MISEAVSTAKVISPIFGGDKYETQIAQLETIRLNGQCAVDLLKSLLNLVHKLNGDITYIKNNNSSLKLQLKELKESVFSLRTAIMLAQGQCLLSRSPTMCPVSIQCSQRHQFLPPVPQLTLEF
jgi:DNA topoisomerase VI subunit A